MINEGTRPAKSTLILLSVFLLGPLLVACSKSSSPSSVEPTPEGLEYVTPEQVGWSSPKLESAKSLAQQSGYAAVMAAFDGKVFLSWGEVSRNYMVHSTRKPFLSALCGIHVGRGEINLNETLGELGIDDIPPSLTQAEKQATVREVLQSRSGVYHEAGAEDSSTMATRPAQGSHPHGTFFSFFCAHFREIFETYRALTKQFPTQKYRRWFSHTLVMSGLLFMQP